MSVVAFDLPMLSAMKRVLAAGLPVRSGHLSEALAAGFGFATHAALLARMRDGVVVASLDRRAFLVRLWSLHGSIDMRQALATWVQAIVYGAEFSMPASEHGGRPIDFGGHGDALCDHMADGCRSIYRARRDLVREDMGALVPLASAPPLADPYAVRPAVVAGRLAFDPFHPFAGHPAVFATVVTKREHPTVMRAIVQEIVDDLGFDREARPRCLKGLASDVPLEDALAWIERSYDRDCPEAESARLAAWLDAAVDGRDPSSMAAALSFAGRSLPVTVGGALTQSLCRRFSLTLHGDVDERDDVLVVARRDGREVFRYHATCPGIVVDAMSHAEVVPPKGDLSLGGIAASYEEIFGPGTFHPFQMEQHRRLAASMATIRGDRPRSPTA